jgi:hypothetical protein
LIYESIMMSELLPKFWIAQILWSNSRLFLIVVPHSFPISIERESKWRSCSVSSILFSCSIY